MGLDHLTEPDGKKEVTKEYQPALLDLFINADPDGSGTSPTYQKQTAAAPDREVGPPHRCQGPAAARY